MAAKKGESMKNEMVVLFLVFVLITSSFGCIGEEPESIAPAATVSSGTVTITDLRLAPEDPSVEDTLTVLVDLQNRGDRSERYTLIVTIGPAIYTREVELKEKSSMTVTLHNELDTGGSVEIAAGDLIKTIFVVPSGDPSPSTTPPPTTSPATEAPIEEGSSFFYVLDGTFVQETTYEYTIRLEREPGNEMYVQTVLIPSVSSYHFSQQVFEQEIEYSEPPDKTMRKKDESGARYERAEWRDPPEEVVVTRTAECKTSVRYSPFITQSRYPLEAQSLPHLSSEQSIQSDDPEIVRQAEEIVEGAESAMDAVVRILNWVRYNIQYTCSKDLKVCEGVLFSDAKRTLEHKKGNCVNFANLAIALLRAAGIPAAQSGGYVADTEHESHANHAWITVYLPEKGFIEFESSYWMPRYGAVPETILMPQHIQYTGVGISNGTFHEVHRSTQEILTSPERERTVTESIDKDDILSFLAYVERDWGEEVYTVSLTAEAPEGWHVSFSDKSLTIDSSYYLSKEVLITIIPPPDAASGDTAEIRITADDGIHQEEIVVSLSIF